MTHLPLVIMTFPKSMSFYKLYIVIYTSTIESNYNSSIKFDRKESDGSANDKKSFAPGLISLAAAGAIVNVPGKKSACTKIGDKEKELKTESNDKMTEVDDGYIESDVLNNSFNVDEDDSNTVKDNSLSDSGYVGDDVKNQLATSHINLPQKKKLKTCKEPLEMDSYAGAGALLDLASSAPKPLKV